MDIVEEDEVGGCGGCWGITQIHRSPSRLRPSVRLTAILINIHEHLIKGLVKASRQSS